MTIGPGIGLCHGSLRDVSAAELVRLAGANGFCSVMLPPVPRASEAEIAGFRGLLEANGIRRVVLDGAMAALPHCPFVGQMGWSVDQHFSVADRFAVDCFNVPHYSGDPATTVSELADALGPFCERAARGGRTVALEFLPGTGIPDLERALRIVEAVGADNLGIALDTWHWARSRASLADLRALPLGIIRDFQISDRAANQDALPDSEQWGRRLPGEGALPLAEIIAIVQANAPQITLNAEIFSEALQARPADEAARDVARALRCVVDAVPTARPRPG